MTIAPDDLILITAVTSGDQASEEIFAERFRERLISLARWRNVPVEDCEDVADETLITAIDQLRRGIFRGDSSIGTWLEKILSGRAADYWRKALRRLQPMRAGEEGEGGQNWSEAGLVSFQSDPVERLIVQGILERMPVRHRRILLLNQRDGYTTDEMSKMLGWPAGTVGRILAKAKAIFRDSVLEGEESGDERRHKK